MYLHIKVPVVPVGVKEIGQAIFRTKFIRYIFYTVLFVYGCVCILHCDIFPHWRSILLRPIVHSLPNSKST
jgi:hypothetical protein